jgi:cyclopropane fatty-acyl-phospholipid synthase-like methyltransferase
MKLPELRHWFGREAARQTPGTRELSAPALGMTQGSPPLCPDVAAEDEQSWSPERLGVVDALWGEGYQFPGGEVETLRLVKPLGLSAASSLLVVGAGSGGPPCSIAGRLGVWVTGYESDRALIGAATERSVRAGLARRAQIETWDPEAPDFEHAYFHHALALEPLREAKLEPILDALAQALKPGGHLVMLETVADTPLAPDDSVVADWQQLDGRRLDRLPSESAVTKALSRLGFDVRIVEDVSRRHLQQAVTGWREAVRALEQAKPSAREAAQLVREAEHWLQRVRLFRTRSLRLVRWHAIGKS